jgi:hypothetical protein
MEVSIFESQISAREYKLWLQSATLSKTSSLNSAKKSAVLQNTASVHLGSLEELRLVPTCYRAACRIYGLSEFTKRQMQQALLHS